MSADHCSLHAFHPEMCIARTGKYCSMSGFLEMPLKGVKVLQNEQVPENGSEAP